MAIEKAMNRVGSRGSRRRIRRDAASIAGVGAPCSLQQDGFGAPEGVDLGFGSVRQAGS